MSECRTVHEIRGFVRLAAADRAGLPGLAHRPDAGDGARGATARPRPVDGPGGVDAPLRAPGRAGGVAGRGAVGRSARRGRRGPRVAKRAAWAARRCGPYPPSVRVVPSFVGKPLASLGAAAKNAIEVARLGGLDTGEQPTPYRVVARDPMYRLRHYGMGMRAESTGSDSTDADSINGDDTGS